MSSTVLLIADIGGYTRFLRDHRVDLAHAHENISRLLEAVIDAAKPFRVAKLEGDAAFLYAPLKSSDLLAQLTDRVGRIRAAFLSRRNRIVGNNLCDCQGCTELGSLKLKFTAHVGEVSFQKVKRYTELAGVDVILVHRMLKNDVPIPEYLLMTDPVRTALDPGLRQAATNLEHDFEGLGPTPTWFLDLAQVTPPVPAAQAGPWWLKGWLNFARFMRALPHALGVGQPCKLFRNIEVLDPPALPSGSVGS